MENLHLDIKNRSTGFDFSFWTEEKLLNLIHSLCRISRNNLSADDASELESALSETLLLYAAVTGKNEIYTSEIIQFICEKGNDAFNCIQYILGLTSQKGPFVEEMLTHNTDEQIMKLITPDKMNRTELHCLLAQMGRKNAWVEEIETDLERVTMGERTWNWFYCKHQNDASHDVDFLGADISSVISYFS